MIFLVSYDLKSPGRDYTGLYDALKAKGPWWHYLDHTWLISTNQTAQNIWDAMRPHITTADRVLIVRIDASTTYSGWLPKDAWEWIANQNRVSGPPRGLLGG